MVLMKKIVSLLLISALGFGLTACSGGSVSLSGNLVKAAVYPKSIGYEDDYAKWQNQNDNKVDREFQNAIASFAGNTSSLLLSGIEENTVYSPVSLYFALSMLASGAENETGEEIFAAMGLEGKDRDYLLEQAGKLYRTLYSDNEVGKLKIANALWMQENFKMNESYAEQLAERLYASSFQVDFRENKTKDLISQWVSENTGGLIQPEVELSKDLVLMLMNTIYFKDGFQDKFDKENTKPAEFFTTDGTSVTTEFMNQTLSRHTYFESDQYTGTTLNFKNSGGITFVLPKEGVTVNDLLADSVVIQEMFSPEERKNADVTLRVPKFEYGGSFRLKDSMMKLGISKAFDKALADFSGISSVAVFVSDILQETHIILDEEGVEAAAYTVIMAETTSAIMEPLEKVEINLNRPFLYGITAEDGTLLFIGVFNNPEA